MISDFLDRPTRDPAPTRGTQVVGIDLGGSNLRAGLYRGELEGGRGAYEAMDQIIEPVGTERSPEGIARRVGDVVRRLADGASGEVPVGIGFAGMLEGRGGFVVNSPHFTWRDVPFGKLLRDELGGRPVAVYNDVNAITFGEYMAGAAIEATDVLGVFVGTGIGGGLICNGELVEGSSNCAAEIGHIKVVLDESARPCNCGLRGCVEAYAGGHYLTRRARAELRGGARSLAVSIAGGIEKVLPSHLDRAAARGDDYALDLFTEIAPLLGVAIANAITLTNPSHVILGGGMLSRTPTLLEHVIAALDVAVNPPATSGLTIATAALGDHAGSVGAALLALSRS